MPWRPGERELLTAVRAAGLATALVTTTPRQIATTVLDRITAELGASPFDATVCGDEVPARKPDPAPYRRALAPLEVEPAVSVVIEDSLVGVTAGLAAGASVLGVRSLQPLDPQLRAGAARQPLRTGRRRPGRVGRCTSRAGGRRRRQPGSVTGSPRAPIRGHGRCPRPTAARP
jgi:beta-phosphoglucomutase-like phosphatase (HAD superfamily)